VEQKAEVETAAQVARVRYRDEDSLWSVAEFEAAEGRFVGVGEFHSIEDGMHLTLKGHWSVHPRYGKQLRVTSYEIVSPRSKAGMVTFLSSGLVRGVGPKLARRLVNRFGVEVLEVIDCEPERLLEVEGIGHTKRDQIVESIRQHRHLQDTLTYLTGLGLTVNMSLKIYREYGTEAVAVVRQDPYRLTREVFGIGFRRADAIARAQGLDPHAPSRIRAALHYCLTGASEREGHTFLPRQELVDSTARLLSAASEEDAPSREEIKGALLMAVASGELVEDDDRVYTARLHEAERVVAARLATLVHAGLQAAPSPSVLEDTLSQVELSMHMEYAPEQRRAVVSAFRSGGMVLTGGPGTGKTTIIGGIIEAACRLAGGMRVLAAAPTGRAARRLGEVTGQEAKTIHRLLEYGFEDGHPVFRRNVQRPLEGDLLIVDESSMVDIMLARQLLEAVPPGMRVIFVGDADQLPPVGPGNFFRDLIDSEFFPVVRLNRIFRQDEVSDIVLNAHRINRGELPRFEREGDSFFLERSGAENVGDFLVDLVEQLISNGTFSAADIQVLSPMHRGPAGVTRLNHLLQERLNPARRGLRELQVGGVAFRPGDKVMCLRNNYEKGIAGIFNGNLGIVRSVIATDDDPSAEEDGLEIDFDGEAVFYGRSEVDELGLAYASTVHKAQGSEFPAVIVPLTASHFIMLQRNLLYTAVTRAQRMLVLVGERKALAMAVRNNQVRQRYTGLARRLESA